MRVSTTVNPDVESIGRLAPVPATVRRLPQHHAVLKSNLPVHNSPFIGRGREILEVAALLGQYRLITLTGIGGIGKTRLALEVARVVVNRYEDGDESVMLFHEAGNETESVGCVCSKAMHLFGVTQSTRFQPSTTTLSACVKVMTSTGWLTPWSTAGLPTSSPARPTPHAAASRSAFRYPTAG
jgi:hypothetical protein